MSREETLFQQNSAPRLEVPQNGYEPLFLTPEQVGQIRAAYYLLALKMLEVGDPTVRSKLRMILAEVGSIDTQIANDNPPDLDSGFGALASIIEGTGIPPFAKLKAVITAADLASCRSFSLEFLKKLRLEIESNPHPGQAEAIAGTLIARYVYNQSRANPDHWPVLFTQTYNQFLPNPVNEETERFHIGAEVAGKTIASLANIGQLQMRYPEALIHQGENEEETYSPNGMPYPDNIMLLQPEKLASEAKLIEAVRTGMPLTPYELPFGLERRIPRVIIGFESPATFQSVTSQKGEVTTIKGRKIVFVYQRPLIKPGNAGPEFSENRAYTDSELQEQGTFDGLPYWIAVRVYRDLRGRAADIKDWPSAVNFQTKYWAGWLTRICASTKDNRRQYSILSVALEESQAIDGNKGWNLEKAQAHIKEFSRALLLKGPGAPTSSRIAHPFLRTPEEIRELYKAHVWEQLNQDDRLAMALTLLKSPSSRLWRFIPQNLKENIAQAILRGGSLSDEAVHFARNALVQCWRNNSNFRMETIRDRLVQVVLP